MFTHTGDQREVSVAMLIASPIIGLLYVVFLPFIGIATLAAMAVSKVMGVAVTAAGKAISFGWRPVESYLTGKRKRNRK